MYDLARQMVRLGQNVKLLTGIPRFNIDLELRSLAKIRTRGVIAGHVMNRYLPRFAEICELNDRILEDFGRWAAKSLSDTDILDALAGTGLETGRILHRQGKMWVCNRGSAHILAQKELLDEEHERWGFSKVKFTERGIRRCLKEYEEADAIVVPSTFNKQTFIRKGIPSEKIYVCPYGVDLKQFSPKEKKDNKFRVLFVGNVSIQKGIGYLIESVRPFIERNKMEAWVIGPLTREGEQILRNNPNIINYLGVKSRDALSWYYSQASVLVLPSIHEGLALVQAQAMACGIPVIATQNTGAQDLYTDGNEGFIVPIHNSKAIQEKLQILMDWPEKLREMSDAAISKVKEFGGWDRYGETVLEMYVQILNSKR